MPSADRRLLIIDAARKAFASKGFDRTSVQEIAAAAHISSALVFQHFPTKELLHQAVLDDLLRDQDEMFAFFGKVDSSAQGLVSMLQQYLSHCIYPSDIYKAEGCRFELSSLAGEGSYARLLSARSATISLERFTQAVEAARTSGELTGAVQDPRNIRSFLHCVGTMLTASSATGEEVLVLSPNRDQVMRDVLTFCAQGLGLNPEFVARALPSEEIPLNPKAPASAPRP